MNPATALPSVFDTQALAQLRTDLRSNDPQALKAVARQFEAAMLQAMLKSMRAATPQNGPFDSDQTRFYQELLDAQLAQAMAARGGAGLAAVIERQLAGGDAALPEEDGFPLAPPARSFPFQDGQRALPLPERIPPAPALPLEGSPVRPALPEDVARAVPSAPSFVAAVWPHALAASRTTGIPAHFLVGHAALESGWGRFEPRFADGRSSHNLFGIKAGSGWSGPAVEATTTEYVDGVAVRRIERFRAYASHAEAFRDYARLLAQSPRYAEVLGSRDAAGFAQGLQRAGYATDPAYAGKLERVIAQIG